MYWIYGSGVKLVEDLATLSQRFIYIQRQETQFNLFLYISGGRALGRHKACICVSCVSVYLSVGRAVSESCVRICLSVSLSI